MTLPMSASPLTPPADLMTALKPIIVHIVAVGLPIAWVTRRMLGAG